MQRRVFLLALGGGALAVYQSAGGAQGYPSKPIRMIVGYSPGAQSDTIARLVAQILGGILETSVVVENRPGANGTIGVALTVQAPPDGYTLGLAGGGPLTLAPVVDNSGRFDVQRDLVPLARIARVPLVLAARAGLPVRDAAQLVEYARKNAGKLTYASGGTSAQMAIESLKVAEGLDILTVPYKGTAPALRDVVAGRVDLALADVAAAEPHVQSGALHLIGNAGSTRSRAFPDVPTMAEQGVTDFVWESWQSIIAPAGIGDDVLAKLQSALRKARASAELRQGLEQLGYELIDEAPEVFASILRSETERFRKLTSRVGRRAN